MRIRHIDRKLQRLESELAYSAGFNAHAVRGFRKVMGWIRNADDERDFYALKGLHYEKLKGSRSHQRSMRLNDQFRLILELEESSQEKVVVIVAIEDYH
ncbi:MAG TPA: type II toxin-antitoxin system RelE/ParE family toxin [Tepidisphaeraceae bacterium]|jgi:proteic killer suppression protein